MSRDGSGNGNGAGDSAGAGEDLDRDFPLGDGTVDLSGVVTCPYCGEASEIALDPGSGARQSYVEDCPVCCQAWSVRVEYDRDGAAHVDVSALE